MNENWKSHSSENDTYMFKFIKKEMITLSRVKVLMSSIPMSPLLAVLLTRRMDFYLQAQPLFHR